LQVESGSSKDSARQMQLSSLKEDAQRYRAERDKLATRTTGRERESERESDIYIYRERESESERERDREKESAPQVLPVD